MRRFTFLFLAGVSVLIIAACTPTPPAPAATPPSPFRTTSSIKDIMDSLVDPSADFLWDSVATVVTAKGTDERRPRSDEDWANVKRRAITLSEATNLLVMDGRHVALPGEKSANPGIELEPEEMEQLITQDRQTFITNAHALQDASQLALAAINKRDTQALLDAGEAIDTACENCHLKYWYPLDRQAQKAKEGAASPRK